MAWMKRAVSASIGSPVLRGALDDLVVDIGDVAHVGDLVAAGAQPARHDVEHHHEARMAEVTVVIDRNAANVHAHLAWNDRLEFLFFARQSVIELEHCDACDL